MSDDVIDPLDPLDAIDFTAPAIVVDDQGIATLAGPLLGMAAVLMVQADDMLMQTGDAVMAVPVDEHTFAVMQGIKDSIELSGRLHAAAAVHSTYDTTPTERNMIRRACHTFLGAVIPLPDPFAEKVLFALGVPMEDEGGPEDDAELQML
jgi:hypothetical protein